MSKRDYKDFLGDVDDIATYWVVRLDAEDCTPEDRFAFDRWRREDPAHEAAYQKIKQGNDYLDRFMSEEAFRERIELARRRTRPPFWRQRAVQWMAATAACLVVAVTVGVSMEWRGGLQSAPIVTASVPVVDFYETKIGERSTVTLSDGSVVTINTDSRVDVLYTPERREIRLVRGQGFFEVAKDLNRPFVVLAGDKRVMALGTVFDVRFDEEDEIQVTLVEGRVQVEDMVGEPDTGSDTPIKLAALPEPVELHPGERLVASVNAAAEVVETDGVEETSWRNGQLVFRQRALAEVVAEMNRYSGQKLVLDDDDRVRAVKVSGVFNNGGPPSVFVDALVVMHPLKAERSGDNELTLVWRD